MAEKSILPTSTAIEAVRLYFVVTKPTFNAVDEHVGISAVLLDTKNASSTVIQKNANYLGLNEWSLEIFVPPFSALEYSACLFLPNKSKVSDFGDTKGLFRPPAVAGFHNHPWLVPSDSEAPKSRTQEHLANIIHKEGCRLRRLIVEEISLRIDLVYGKNEAKVTEMTSHLTPTGNPLNIRVPLPEDTGFYNPDIRHFIDMDYKDNCLSDSKLYSVEIGAANDKIYHTMKDPVMLLGSDKCEKVTSLTSLIQADKSMTETTNTPPTVGFQLPSYSSMWNVAKYGLPVVGLGLAAALYYKYK